MGYRVNTGGTFPPGLVGDAGEGVALQTLSLVPLMGQVWVEGVREEGRIAEEGGREALGEL